MDQELSRNLNILVWQYINWRILLQYIDNLKSRIYKSFIQKSYEKTYSLQSFLINSPLVKLIAYKRIIELYGDIIELTTFELGYLVSYMSLDSNLDITILIDYGDDGYLALSQKISLIIKRVKNLIIIWSIEPYLNYLYYLNTFSFCRYYRKQIFTNVNHNLYGLNLNLFSLFYYIDLSVIISRMSVLNTIKKNIYEFLDQGRFVVLVESLDRSLGLSSLERQKLSLSNMIISIIILKICYEMNILLKSYSNFQFFDSKYFTIIRSISGLLVFCQDAYQLNLLKQVFLDISVSYGIEVKEKRDNGIMPLLQGINSKIDFIAIDQSVNPIHMIFRPSLRYQFFLLKQISLIFIKSKAPFLLIIRFNMLILSWSALYRNRQAKKIFSLLDYLIYMKLKSLIANQHSNWSKQKIKFKYFSKSLFYFNTVQINNNWIFSSSISNANYYRFYFSIKLSWLIR